MKKLFFLLAVAACGGGGSGVDGGKKLVDLTSAEQMKICQYFHDSYTERTITCTSGGQTTTFHVGGQDVAQCVSSLQANITGAPNCAATVGQGEACFSAEYDEPDSFYCSDSAVVPPECTPLMTAECGG